MRYITIIRGAYGHRKAQGITETKTPTDAPFAVPEAEAARLVKLGVARYAEVPADHLVAPPEYDTEMHVDVLRGFMKDVGLKAPVGMSKVDMVAALDEFYGVEPEDDEPDPGGDDEPEGDPEADGEGPPVPDVEEPVT